MSRPVRLTPGRCPDCGNEALLCQDGICLSCYHAHARRFEVIASLIAVVVLVTLGLIFFYTHGID